MLNIWINLRGLGTRLWLPRGNGLILQWYDRIILVQIIFIYFSLSYYLWRHSRKNLTMLESKFSRLYKQYACCTATQGALSLRPAVNLRSLEVIKSYSSNKSIPYLGHSQPTKLLLSTLWKNNRLFAYDTVDSLFSQVGVTAAAWENQFWALGLEPGQH